MFLATAVAVILSVVALRMSTFVVPVDVFRNVTVTSDAEHRETRLVKLSRYRLGERYYLL